MKSCLPRAAAGLTALVIVLGAAGAGANPLTRAQALAALDDRSAETRRTAVTSLAERGTMEDVSRLARALRDADPLVRALAEAAMWQVWSRSGDDAIDHLLAVGIEQMSERRSDAAVDTFTEIITRRPEFAEGWNKRATVLYLLGDYQKSLADCDEVMKRNPHHFGALSGYGMIYVKLGDLTRALAYFERALAVNPNLTQVRESVDALRELIIQRRKDAI